MPKYLVLFNLSSDFVAGMIEKPSDRRSSVAAAAENAGGKLLDYYWMFGQYDGAAIFEFPNSRKVASFMLAVSARASLTRMETHELLEASDLEGIAADAKGITYTAPTKKK
jgi:uncharacterized protein with GYD domain